MTIYGLSPTNGAERTLELEQTPAGIRLHSQDGESYRDIDTIVVEPGALLTALIDRPAGQTAIRSVSAPGEAAKLLDLAVRGNEVTLRVRSETGTGWDIAVGLDDFQDALEEASDAA